jgi:hypothetical protein
MFIDQMIDLQNVAPGQVAVLKLAYQATFDKIHLYLGGSPTALTKAQIGLIEGKANGVQFFVDSGAEIQQRESYFGNFQDAAILTLDFTEPNTKGGAAAQYLASIPRNLLQSLTFEVTILGTAPAGITMQAEAEYRDPTQNPYVLRRKKFNVPLPNTGENDVLMPVGVGGGLIKRVWIHHQGQVTKAELRTNGTPRIRTLDTRLQYVEKRNKLVPQANLTVLDFIADGNLMGMLNTAAVKEVLLRLTSSAGGSATIYVDYIDPLTNLH